LSVCQAIGFSVFLPASKKATINLETQRLAVKELMEKFSVEAQKIGVVL
jgi:hypothetical protein